MVFALAGNTTIGVSDVGAFIGEVYGDFVLGTSVESGVGAVGIHSDVAVTLPQSDDPFVRGVVGVDLTPTGSTFVSIEAYVQTFGAASADEYIDVSADPRVVRGEVWQLGQYYLGASVNQEVSPLLSVNIALIANLGDPSMLAMPGLNYSVSERSDLAVGAFMGVGKHPTTSTMADLLLQSLAADPFGIQSEYGLVPVTAYAQWRSYC
jgi:hypothetical protein